MSTPLVELSLDDVTLLHRWLLLMQQDHPQIPAVLVHHYAETDGVPTAESIADVLGCPVDNAEDWRRLLETALLPPAVYADVFAAEERLSERRMQWESYQDDCRDTAHRLQELQAQIVAMLAYRHSLRDPEDVTEVQAKIDSLDQERLDLLRHQGDLPGVGRLIHEAVDEAQAHLTEAQEALKQAQIEQLQATEATWIQEGIALCAPIRHLLQRAGWLDQAWERLGVTVSREVGRGRLREVCLGQVGG